MSECKQCCKGIESTGNRPKVFCSDRCRMAFNRTSLSEHYTGAENLQSEQATADNKVVRDRVAQSLRDERQQGGATATPGERSSSTGDPRDTESGMARAIAASAKLVADEANPPTSQCYRDSGIPLPGGPGYQGVCLPDANGRWLLDSHRQRLTHAEERMRYAHV